MQKRLTIIRCVMCISIIFLFSGCGSSLLRNYGRITPDPNVTNDFEKYQVNPNYNYYISGSDIYPIAIIGLDKAYKLESDLWKHVEMTHEKLREFVQNMRNKVDLIKWGQAPYGSAMADDNGKQIGVWYSVLGVKTSLNVKDDHAVEIITPDIDTYLKND
ncbi:MAG: hypothetical protein ACXWMH_03045 [Syntrophales bacterium]